MPTKPRFDPMPPAANDVALDGAVRPFIERFIREDKRERALGLFLPKAAATEWRGLIHMIDERRARTFAPTELVPWNAVRGVFFVGKDAWSVSSETAAGLYVTEDAMFIAYSAQFATVRSEHGAPLLLT